MEHPQYALVAYLKSSLGEFVENLRRELHPALPHLPAHVTILPPRTLVAAENSPADANEAAALEYLAESCRVVERFDIVLGDAESFVPVTPTLFIRVAHAAYKLRELHDRLNSGVLFSEEQWPYMPHLTIAKMATEQQALEGYDVARERWNAYEGSRRISVEELTFVREAAPGTWVDLAPIRLGSTLVSGKTR
jgi:2'-5' RNA ligase